MRNFKIFVKTPNIIKNWLISPPFRRHKLYGNRNGQFAIDIVKQYRLIFRQKENNIIIEDLKRIKEIEIMEVSKHYE